MQQKLILIASVVFAVLAFFLSQRYIKKKYDELYAGARKVPVLIVKEDIASGTTIGGQNVGIGKLYESAVRGSDIVLVKAESKEHELVFNRSTEKPLREGAPLRWSDVNIDYYQQKSASIAVKKGMRALSIPASGVRAVSGLVKPNDRVDIIATYTQSVPGGNAVLEEISTTTMIQKVNVIAVGNDFGASSAEDRSRRGMGNRGYSMITIEVTPEEAELIVHVVETKGSLTLTLRNPLDSVVSTDLPEVEASNLKLRADELNEKRKNLRGTNF